MGIVVLITLILALELVDSKSDSQTSKTEAQTDKTAKTAEELQEEIDKMRAALAKTFEDSDTIVTSNVSVLNEMVNKAEEDRDNWENELDQNSETLGNAKERKEDSEQYANDTKDGIEEEIERLKKENEELARKVKKLESGGRRLFRKGNENQTTWLVEITTKGICVCSHWRVRKTPSPMVRPKHFIVGCNHSTPTPRMFMHASNRMAPRYSVTPTNGTWKPSYASVSVIGASGYWRKFWTMKRGRGSRHGETAKILHPSAAWNCCWITDLQHLWRNNLDCPAGRDFD